MTGSLHLRISTPVKVLVDSEGVRSVRAMDASGSFGILPGHTEMLTVVPASVVEWCEADGRRQYCAVRGGVLTVAEGRRVTVASRQAVCGRSLDELEGVVHEARQADTDADRRARVEQLRFHAQAVRHLLQYLLPGGERGIMPGLPGKDWP